MKNCIPFFLSFLMFISSGLFAQVQVSKEPHHKNVLENKYLRVLDVHIAPSDTTLYHIHSTPAVTVMFTTTAIGVQNKGREWGKGRNVAGRVSYGAFLNDSLVHRVSNWDTGAFHVQVIELLSAYKGAAQDKLPFTVLFDNDKTTAYRITDALSDKQVITGRGPTVAALVNGNQVVFHDMNAKKDVTMKPGDYIYITPESRFFFSSPGENQNLVLFEIK